MNYQDFMREDRRLIILRLLAEQPGGMLNDSVLHALLERCGHTVARDVVRADVAWLRDSQLIDVEEVLGRVLVATIVERGSEVAAGYTTVPGVRRPGPRR